MSVGQSDAPKRRNPIYRALYRPLLVFGAEANLVIGVAAICGFIGFVSWDPWVAGVCAAIWLVTLPLLQSAAKKDPQLRLVYVRLRKYRRHYAPRSTPFVKLTKKTSKK